MCSKSLLLTIFKFLIVSSEVITLIKDNDLKCVLTEESVNLPFTVKNRNCDFKSERTLLKLDDQWNVSQNIEMFELEYDIRLAGMEPHHTNFFQLKNMTFFMCVDENSALKILNERNKELSKVEIKQKTGDDQSCEWQLCKLLQINHTVVLESCGNYSNTFDRNETKFWIKLSEPPYIYKPNYYYSNKINVNNTSIKLNSSECVSMFVSIDEGCTLEIYLNNNVTHQVKGFNKKGVLKTWKLQKIPTQGANVMTIIRNKESNKTEGFWAIYKIRECPPNNIEIFNPTCKNITNETRCGPYRKESNIFNRIWNKPYYLANKSCEQILGSSYKHCEKHKICFGNNCHCAWGYEGFNCNKTCNGTNYGLDCKETYFRPYFESSNSNVDVYLNLTHITISWLFPKNNIHYVEYKCESKFCNTIEKKREEVTAKQTLDVKNQVFANCEVTFLTLNKSQEKKINFHTKTNFPIQNVEFPEIEIDISGINVKFNECRDFLGTVNFSVQYACLDKWCNSKSDIFSLNLNESYKKSYKINRRLESDATYRFQVTATRQGESQSMRFKKICKPGVTHPLQNLSLYGSDSEKIYIRWMEPDPLTGPIEKYYFSFQKTGKESKNRFEKIDAETCTLWNSYVCGQVPKPNNTSFNIYVYYKYYGVSNVSSSTELIINNLKNFTYAPENFRVKCSKGNHFEVILEWEHPSYTYGRFSFFNITLKNKNNEEYLIKSIERYESKYNQTIVVNENEEVKIEVSVANGKSGIASITVFGKSIYNSYLCYLHKGTYYVSVPKNNETCKKIEDEYGLNCTFCKSSEDTYFCEATLDYAKKNYGKNENQFSENLETKNNNLKALIATTSLIVLLLVIVIVSALSCLCKRQIKNKSTKPIRITEVLSREELNRLVEDALQNSNTTSQPKKLINTLNNEYCGLLGQKEKTLNNDSNKNSSGTVQCYNFENYQLKLLEKQIPSTSESDCQKKYLPSEDEDKYTKIQTNVLESHLKQTLLETEDKLINQFCALPHKIQASSYYANQSKNKKKNRDHKHIPYDYNRVVLHPLEGLGKDDYINASYIEGFENPKAYIATQGPKFSTIRDFWRMVWQEQVETIVMVANFIEEKKRKCAEYFPLIPGTVFECGEIFIKLLSEETHEHYITRFLTVKYKDHKRNIQHFQLKWSPDNATSFYPNMVVPLLRKFSSIRCFPPIVVHCSSGVNRTGTLILCDLALQMAKKEKCVDFYNILGKLRNQRPYMIPSKKQYLLAHLVVLECLMEEENVFKKSLKENMIEEVLMKQLFYVDRISWHNAVIDKWMPHQKKQVIDSFYTVDGYMAPGKFMTTKIPDAENLNSFWKFVIILNINVIVILQKEKEMMWPFNRRNPRTVISVEAKNEIETWYSTVNELQIIVYNLRRGTIIFEKTIRCYKIKCNNLLESESTKELLSILDDVNKFSLGQGNKQPSLIICNDGITVCGLYTSLSYIIEKYQQEIEFDICNALQTVRKSGAPFVKTTEQLEFIYKASLKYLTKFDKYSHIM